MVLAALGAYFALLAVGLLHRLLHLGQRLLTSGDEALDGGCDADLIATTCCGQDQAVVLNVDLRIVLRFDVQGLDGLEVEGAHRARCGVHRPGGPIRCIG